MTPPGSVCLLGESRIVMLSLSAGVRGRPVALLLRLQLGSGQNRGTPGLGSEDENFGRIASEAGLGSSMRSAESRPVTENGLLPRVPARR